jgi:hypothetical protein
MERRRGDRRGPAAFKTVGLTRRGPPTYRQRREWSKHVKENCRSSPIPSHLSLRAKVGGPTTDLFLLPSKIKIQQTSIDNSSTTTPLATSRRGAAAQPYLFHRQLTTDN